MKYFICCSFKNKIFLQRSQEDVHGAAWKWSVCRFKTEIRFLWKENAQIWKTWLYFHNKMKYFICYSFKMKCFCRNQKEIFMYQLKSEDFCRFKRTKTQIRIFKAKIVLCLSKYFKDIQWRLQEITRLSEIRIKVSIPVKIFIFFEFIRVSSKFEAKKWSWRPRKEANSSKIRSKTQKNENASLRSGKIVPRAYQRFSKNVIL